MDLNTCNQIKLSSLDEHIKHVVNKIQPDLCEIIFYEFNGIVFNTDFFFKGEPDEACDCSEFEFDTQDKLVLIVDIIRVYLGLRWKEE